MPEQPLIKFTFLFVHTFVHSRLFQQSTKAFARTHTYRRQLSSWLQSIHERNTNSVPFLSWIHYYYYLFVKYLISVCLRERSWFQFHIGACIQAHTGRTVMTSSSSIIVRWRPFIVFCYKLNIEPNTLCFWVVQLWDGTRISFSLSQWLFQWFEIIETKAFSAQRVPRVRKTSMIRVRCAGSEDACQRKFAQVNSIH